MIDYLFVAIVICALHSRRTAAVIFVFLMLVHDQMFRNTLAIDYWQYYLSAAVFAVVAMGAMAFFSEVCEVTTGLLLVCACSFLLNGHGCLLWFNFQPIVNYDIGALVLYCVAILIILRKGKAKDECSRGINIFPAARRKHFAFSCSLSKED